MKTKLKNLSIIFILVAFLLPACTGTSNKGKNDQTVAEKIINKQDIKPDIKEALYQFPTPLETTVMLNKAKAAFIFDLTNPVDNIDLYMAEQTKALFLGVYSADLSYAAVYNRTDELESLMDCTTSLSDDLGISGVYNENLVESVKENLSNKDSLVSLLTEVFNDTKVFLSENNRDEVSVLIVTGGFIETLYLASNLNITSENQKEITGIIYKQGDNISKLINILGVFEDEDLMVDLAESLTEVKTFLEENPLPEAEGLTKEKLEELQTVVDEVRNSIQV